MSASLLLLLGTDGESTRIVYHRLEQRFGPIPVILEQPISRLALLRVRLRKLGPAAVLSQLAFMVAARPLLRRLAAGRIAQIKTQNSLDASPIPAEQVTGVTSVNAPETIARIAKAAPKVIVVNGTRIISKDVLASTAAVILNVHAGITPKYRGTHGGYWALYNGEPRLCGVTVHLVDAGIDSGAIIDQTPIAPTAEDSFETYPYLQIAAALPLLLQAVEHALAGKVRARAGDGPSAVWYHPGLFQYLRGRLRGVR